MIYSSWKPQIQLFFLCLKITQINKNTAMEKTADLA